MVEAIERVDSILLKTKNGMEVFSVDDEVLIQLHDNTFKKGLIKDMSLDMLDLVIDSPKSYFGEKIRVHFRNMCHIDKLP